MEQQKVSIIIPAKNEGLSLPALLPRIKELHPEFEIIVIDDGSTDDTAAICQHHGVKVIHHPYSMGNGAAIKSGSRAAAGDVLVFMDADGQHRPGDIQGLLDKFAEGYDMVVGARQSDTHASIGRRLANNIYNGLASIMTGYNIQDLTSGFRAARARHFRKFLYLLPNGFSYPTTSTMAFFRSGLPVAYVPIRAEQRAGKSKIRMVRDGTRFLLIIIKIGALFSPMRFFLPISLISFMVGLVYYSYTYYLYHSFTNMSALMFTTSILVFLIGILSEQISALHYRGADQDHRFTARDQQSNRDAGEAD
ncbi:MAG: glycosyltransferase family 2 protein [Thiogranum sp.]|nr:glycosyltransferase family 2 protein [Thiogranum sp.]